jgi:hypothetical protein
MHSAWLSVLVAWIVRHGSRITHRELFHVKQIKTDLGSLATGRASLTTGHRPRTTHHRPRIVSRETLAANHGPRNTQHATRNTQHATRNTGRELGKVATENGPRSAGPFYLNENQYHYYLDLDSHLPGVFSFLNMIRFFTWCFT